jgi:hypothetical protein
MSCFQNFKTSSDVLVSTYAFDLSFEKHSVCVLQYSRTAEKAHIDSYLSNLSRNKQSASLMKSATT